MNIPSRTSSNLKQEPGSSAAVANDGTAEESAHAGQGTRRSLLSRPRNGSKTSSRQSLRAQSKPEEARQSTTVIPQTDGPARSEKKGKTGFLFFLNCCSSPEITEDKDDPALPPKKTTKLQPVAQRSSRTAEKAGNSEAEPRDADHRPVSDEKNPLTAEDEEAKVMSEKPPINDVRPQISREESSHDKVTPMPAILPLVNSSNPSANVDEQYNATTQAPMASTVLSAYGQVTNSQTNVQASTLVEPIDVEGSHGPVHDEQPNSDVVMTDSVTEVAKEEHDEVAEPTQPEIPAPISQVDLPPPPPLSKRESQLASKDIPPVPGSSSEKQTWLLPPVQPRFQGRKCLVLDLDETLVHSSFKILNQADFTIPVEIEGQYHNVYVIKRPGVDAFMKRVGELYEVVVFTASVSKYGDPLLDQLDIHHVVHHRLFRESCYNHQGNYVKVGHSASYTIVLR